MATRVTAGDQPRAGGQSRRRRKPTVEGPRADGGTPPQGGSSPPAILLVEDDPDIAEMYSRGLGAEGMDVTMAGDAETALRLAGTLAHDLILMDLGLPGGGGLSVIRSLRADPRTANVPLVILSNFSAWMVPESEDLGVLAHVVKAETPPTRLADLVRGWLEVAQPA